jgi:hypothetical protein
MVVATAITADPWLRLLGSTEMDNNEFLTETLVIDERGVEIKRHQE